MAILALMKTAGTTPEVARSEHVQAFREEHDRPTNISNRILGVYEKAPCITPVYPMELLVFMETAGIIPE